MKRQAHCPVCGREFTANRVTQKYCSARCRLYAYRHQARTAEPELTGRTILRTFRCIRCNEQVNVTRQEDKRTKFCSSRCERLYWKHPENVRSRAVQNVFQCRNCGVTVEVRDAHDRRTAFCSAACRKQWFSLHRRKSH